MRVTVSAIPDVLFFEPEVFGDNRGYFFESFRQDEVETQIGKVSFVQDNESKSGYGVLRGLHFQKPPFTQSKLVRAVQGRVLDVAVDIRQGSPWYGRHVSCLLDGDRKNMMWVPKGFAHGFVVLSEAAVFAYKCDNYYTPSHDAGIMWNDPALGIDWTLPQEDIRVSAKDACQPFFDQIDLFPYNEYRQEKLYPGKAPHV
ncbi:dTDP-4-dehydrorhamnose 3,5-epimerase [Chlorobium sp. BLA1]|uniref:dTDP-4-dehydrorhamnose 3,5-epimerase n=1 Tax=Candidatus Chlorobium masyuteum TaxID=2716876 RepID=UPI001420B1AE|nr:dTDP-4-dehydrorhamnose 3,5-epimerase [Candidatus Chlorobium masyuteum]NHQ59172.1 dTDP-4-dehydrorhamnose 3,5-epimerase [Candidatus Chlorobium masyuteum]